MKVVLDTNIIQKDYFLQSNRFAILLDYLQKIDTKIVFTRIVYDEIEANYRKELLKNINIYNRSKNSLEKNLRFSDIPEISIDAEMETASYMKYILEKLGVWHEEILEYRENYLQEVVQRSIHRRRPCSGSGEEIRDAILWLSVLDVASQEFDKSAIFISNNTKQFAQKDGDLHPDLVEDCHKNELKIIYHTSLESFIKQHAEPIDFISKEWIESHVSPDNLIKEIKDEIEKLCIDEIVPLLNMNQNITGYFNLSTWYSDISSFYVYKMQDESVVVEVQYEGEAEVECEVETIALKEFYEPTTEIMVTSSTRKGEELVIRNMSEVATSIEIITPRLFATVSINIDKGMFQSASIVDYSIE